MKYIVAGELLLLVGCTPDLGMSNADIVKEKNFCEQNNMSYELQYDMLGRVRRVTCTTAKERKP